MFGGVLTPSANLIPGLVLVSFSSATVIPLAIGMGSRKGAALDQLARLATLPDDQIDLSDIPELTDEEWATARRGVRTRNDPATIRVDPAVLARFENHAEEGGHHAEINRVLRRQSTEIRNREMERPVALTPEPATLATQRSR